MKPPLRPMLLGVASAWTAVLLALLAGWCAARAFPHARFQPGDERGRGSRWWRCGAWLLRRSQSCMRASERYDATPPAWQRGDEKVDD